MKTGLAFRILQKMPGGEDFDQVSGGIGLSKEIKDIAVSVYQSGLG